MIIASANRRYDYVRSISAVAEYDFVIKQLAPRATRGLSASYGGTSIQLSEYHGVNVSPALLLSERLCLLVATDLALILLGTRRRDVVWRDERRAVHIPLTRSCLPEQLLHLKCNKGRWWKKGEREAGKSGTRPTLRGSGECGLSHVSRHISNFTVFSPFFAAFSTSASSSSSSPYDYFPPPSPLLPLSGSFPRFWLSLSSAIRQSSCQIKFVGEQSPRSARRIPCNRGDDKKWMLRNFRIGKTRKKMYYISTHSFPPYCRFLLLDWYIFYSRGRCLLFSRRLRDSLSDLLAR